MSRPDGFGAAYLPCPVCGTKTEPIDSGPSGHRRRCPRCRMVMVLPRVALRAAMLRVAKGHRR